MIERIDTLERAVDLYRQGSSLAAEALCEQHLSICADDPAALSLLADIRLTFEGRFLRGRLGSGILRHLGLDELVATSVDGYINSATRLAESSTYRAAIREKLGLAASRAYRDVKTVDALARVLLEHPA